MMKLRLEILLDNEAFGDSRGECGAEIAKILRSAADYLNDAGAGVGTGRWLRDTNGNTVGKITVEAE